MQFYLDKWPILRGTASSLSSDEALKKNSFSIDPYIESTCGETVCDFWDKFQGLNKHHEHIYITKKIYEKILLQYSKGDRFYQYAISGKYVRPYVGTVSYILKDKHITCAMYYRYESTSDLMTISIFIFAGKNGKFISAMEAVDKGPTIQVLKIFGHMPRELIKQTWIVTKMLLIFVDHAKPEEDRIYLAKLKNDHKKKSKVVNTQTKLPLLIFDDHIYNNAIDVKVVEVVGHYRWQWYGKKTNKYQKQIYISPYNKNIKAKDL